ncbi:DUF2815 domain-containing protein, partial [Xylella fastidiosa subsp. multiplex]|nr:DUF2815 domain-containing protein [Xylella fastidiosa subsp. multiplex]MRT95286.1 DUF2815 domain-containing protein [Xylella fastidiosa subsp. multiplex]MRU27464.1 DUF2815 domain-containing protein [Xylella fastidiosa subsp. multiplex]MRU29908.1 DUF2815 domain-containing protein [Xylella fastidiosa subsp. multiplex]MRU32408.1 DUF2815 domain-containing protein [Xylella fastidiosa subsp. multiplex]
VEDFEDLSAIAEVMDVEGAMSWG